MKGGSPAHSDLPSLEKTECCVKLLSEGDGKPKARGQKGMKENILRGHFVDGKLRDWVRNLMGCNPIAQSPACIYSKMNDLKVWHRVCLGLKEKM